MTQKCQWLWPPQCSGVNSNLGLFEVETTVVGIVRGILVAHIDRCVLFFVGLQQAILCHVVHADQFVSNFVQHGKASSSASVLE